MIKKIFNLLFLPALLVLMMTSCEKDGAMVVATTGTQPGLTASATTLNYTQADSLSNAVTFTYAPSEYGYQAAVNYDLQISYNDSNFLAFKDYSLSKDTLYMSFTVQEFNSLLLSLNYKADATDTILIRVKSEVAGTAGGNSSMYQYSDTLQMIVHTYSGVPIPVIAPPDSLYIVGDATPGGWSNPVPIPSQKFTQIDEYGQIFAIVLPLIGGKTFLLLPKNGDWSHKYGGSTAGSGNLLVDDAVPGSNTPGPESSGLYEIIVNFTKGTYSVTPITTNPIPNNLYIVGDATAGGWDNPVPIPSQQFTQISNAEYQITIPLSSTGTYVFLPKNGDWSHKFGGVSATGGTLLADGSVPSSNTPGPATSGTYQINVNFLANTYSLKKQ